MSAPLYLPSSSAATTCSWPKRLAQTIAGQRKCSPWSTRSRGAPSWMSCSTRGRLFWIVARISCVEPIIVCRPPPGPTKVKLSRRASRACTAPHCRRRLLTIMSFVEPRSPRRHVSPQSQSACEASAEQPRAATRGSTSRKRSPSAESAAGPRKGGGRGAGGGGGGCGGATGTGTGASASRTRVSDEDESGASDIATAVGYW